MDRHLDGVYFRVNRNGKWESVCFSDLTEEQMDEVLKNKNEEWLKGMCKILGRTIKAMGDQCDIVLKGEEDA